ncbi:MAG: hypothetical protein M3Y29_04040 [Chloroflexota bacterium]|jgi:hypothetical protein|nr:hypothetical protein [Chloroflexota bacterium]
MTDPDRRDSTDDRPAPDSLSGKLREHFASDDDTDGTTKLETDAGAHVPASADEPPHTGPKRPTDPPF